MPKKFSDLGLAVALLAILTTSPQAKSLETTEDTCTFSRLGTEGVHITRRFFAPKTCYLDLNPVETESGFYRSYLLNGNGLLMVFNSFGWEEDPMSTGARVFYFFPRTQMPIAQTQGDDVTFQTASGAEFSMDGLNGNITGLVDGEITLTESVEPGNGGGLEIPKHAGLLLDVGFAFGHDPVMEATRVVTFEDGKSQKCEMKASEVFTYIKDDYILKHASDQELSAFLKVRCPQIEVNF